MNNECRPILLNYDDAAKTLGLTRPALRDLVYKGRGPTIVKLNKRTMFAYKDLEAWVDQHRQPSPNLPTVEKPKRKRGRPSIADNIAMGNV